MVENDRAFGRLGRFGTLHVITPDAILVCPRDKTQQIRDVVDALKDAGRSEHIRHVKGDSDESGS